MIDPKTAQKDNRTRLPGGYGTLPNRILQYGAAAAFFLLSSTIPALASEGSDGPAVPNPVIDDLADSGVMRYNGEYYIMGNWISGRMLSSENLLDWGNRTHVFSMDNEWAMGDAGRDREIHACDLNYVDGVFHLYWSVNRSDIVRAIGHATTTGDPMNFYREPVTERPFSEKIDPHLFIDDDGSAYFYSTKFPEGLGNVIYGRRMEDPWTLTGEEIQLLSPSQGTWETQDALVNEAQWVFRYRDRYYMLYNANHTRFAGYAIGCAAQDDGPLAFRNEHKYAEPVLQKLSRSGHEITHTGQPSVVRGPNGFEWWIVYFAKYDDGPRSIGIDRILFFDRKLHVDGPTSPLTATEETFSPPPAPATFRDLFNEGAAPDNRWKVESGEWDLHDGQARQREASGSRTRMIARSEPARNYVAEANVKIGSDGDTYERAGLVAYYKNPDNWLHIALDPDSGGWTYIKREAGTETSKTYPLGDTHDFHVHRNLRVEKNGDHFRVWIDGRPAPGDPAIETAFAGRGVPGLFTDRARANFDGFLYTIGWDEYGDGINGWVEAPGRENPEDTWMIGPAGIASPGGPGTNRVLKGDRLAEYEFITQVTPTATSGGDGNSRAGFVPVYVDDNHFLSALVDPSTGELIVGGVKNGEPVATQTVSLDDSNSYNLRAIKSADATRIFVDGVLEMTVPIAWGPSRVGLMTENAHAAFNGITLFDRASR